MTERLNDRDWILISAYLDARLSPADSARVEKRLEEDHLFKQSIDEIAYTKHLLAALPQKRAPRNFTLTTEKVQKPLRGLWLQPALSFISVAAAVLLVVIFSFNYLGLGSFRQAAAPQAEMLVAENAITEQEAPAIINWNPVPGMGGGAADAKEVYTGGDGIGGAGGPGFPVAAPGLGGGEPLEIVDPELNPEAAPEIPLPAEPAPAATAEPAPSTFAEAEAATQQGEPTPDSDLSNLILGLPEEGTAGQVVATAPLREEPASQPQRTFSVPNLVMLIAGITAVLAGAGALIHRKKFHA